MKTRLPALIVVLIAAQIVCASVFLVDVLQDSAALPALDWSLLPEALASLALLVGIGLQTAYLVQLLRRKASLEHSVQLASSALQEVIEDHFRIWNLTASERDVAGFMIKGLNNSEIAQLRGSAEGTIKAHLNAVYRKAGARNRAEVLSNIMDSLIGKPLLQTPKQSA
jgi:DNA-binding CsgD family transcriptional regulator